MTMYTNFVWLLPLLCFMNAESITTKNRIAKLQDDLKAVNDIIQQQRMALMRVNSQLDISEADMKELTDYHYGKRQSSNTAPVVGFTAAITHSISGLQTGQTLIYETVLTNVHSGYNNTTGMFTCPVSGLYEFAASIVSSAHHENRVDAELVKDGAALVHLSAHGAGFDTGSHVVMTHCNQTEKVWVRHVATLHGSNHMLATRPSYFSGHLISSD